ncbi:MAG: PKD repeat protein [Flavobacteriaceae bacterium]|jgi:PKD repeat protein
MRNSLFLSGVIIFLLSSCNKRPLADFAISNEAPAPNEVIHFTSQSLDALTFEWDFGDGTTSTAENPAHIYTEAGTYFVQLVVHNKKGKKSDAHAISLTVQNDTFDKMTHLWSFDESTTKNYQNGIFVGESTTILSDLFSTHTLEFKSDNSYLTVFDAITNGGTWTLNEAGDYFEIDGQNAHINVLTNNAFEFITVSINDTGADVFTDSTFSILSR